MQNGVVINFEKIGPDPPPIEKLEDGKDELALNKDAEFDALANDRNNVPNVIPPQNTSWYTCRKMIYVPRQQKGYPFGKTISNRNLFFDGTIITFASIVSLI